MHDDPMTMWAGDDDLLDVTATPLKVALQIGYDAGGIAHRLARIGGEHGMTMIWHNDDHRDDVHDGGVELKP